MVASECLVKLWNCKALRSTGLSPGRKILAFVESWTPYWRKLTSQSFANKPKLVTRRVKDHSKRENLSQ